MALIKSYFHQLSRAFAATGRVMWKHEVPRDAASISYFSLLALIPSILVLIALGDIFLGWMDLRQSVILQVSALVPGSRKFLSSNLDDLTNPSSAIVLSCVAVVFWSSSWIFAFIESAIDRAWGVPSQRTFWERRLLSIAFMILGGTSLLFSAIITALAGAVRAHADSEYLASQMTTYLLDWVWYLILIATGILIAILVFTLLFKLVPHCNVLWVEAFSGAAVATIMWEIGSIVFVWLLPYFNYQKIYGRMGAFIALLVWVYTSNVIIIFGASISAQMNKIAAANMVQGPENLPNERIRRFPSGH
jgi:membrane protein